MVAYLDNRMVNTHNGWVGAENAQGYGNLPPPLTLAQAIASIFESRGEETKLQRQLVANSAHGGYGARNAPGLAPTTYSDFAATHPLLFIEAGEHLEADHWIRGIESKFGLLHCTEVQKTLHHAAAAWSRQRMVGQLHRHSTPVHGGPTTLPLAPRTTRCRGLSSATPFAPTTFQ
jgi:hypothetical protein